MKNSSNIKLPTSLDLGTVLPGHYGQSMLPLISSEPAFLSLGFSAKSIQNGFFLVKEGSNQCAQSLSLVLKPNKKMQVLVGCFSRELNESIDLKGELIVTEAEKQYKIKLIFRIEVPKIICKKMLEDTSCDMKIVRLVVNKAVTSDVRIPLFNQQDYSLELTPSLLVKPSISDRQNPFILKTQTSAIKAQGKQQFFIILSINTNIGYKNEHKGLKKIVFRNVLHLATNSDMFWCLPLEIIVVFVKQPEFKSEE